MAVLKDLIVHGQSRFINGARFNTINAESIGADAGIFNKLIATSLDAKTATIDNLTAKNATVTALLDVQGELHTNSWSNANIATIDGSFYISPTSSSADGSDVDVSGYSPTGTITYNNNNNNYTTLTVTGTFNTSQLSLGNATNVAWPANSYVIITGDVLIGNEWYPLGTIRGKLQNQLEANTNSKTITVIPIGATIIDGEVGSSSLTDGHGLKPQTLEAIRIAMPSAVTGITLKMRKIKVSMTSYGGTYQSPIGIFMTAMGSNKKTFLDIYGGSNNTTTIPSGSGALALPTVRIGNLEGMPAVGGITPHGWGIYTNNGFFTGTVVAERGKIGNWNIGTDTNKSLYTNSFNTSGGIYISPSYAGVLTIAGNTSKNWAFTAGANFGVTTDGKLYSSGAELSGNVAATQGFTVTGSVGGATLASMTSSGITLGQTSGGQYNVLVDNTGIKLRYNTSVLNLIDTSGMKLYLSSDTTNAVAQFGSTMRIGKENGAAFHINADSLQAYYVDDEEERELYFQVSPNSMSYGSHVVVDSDYLRDNYLNSSDTSIAIASATDGKLNSSQGNGRVSWDEFGTLTITREIPSSNETYAIEIGAQGIEFQYQGRPAASIDKDRLIIDKTVVLDEMQVGKDKWAWKIDQNDDSIFLKWIG